MQDETMTAAIRRVVTEADCSRELARRMAARFGWRGSDRAIRIRVAQMLSEAGERRFPVDALPDVIELTGSSDVLGPAATALYRAASADRAPMARVAPSRTQHDRRRA